MLMVIHDMWLQDNDGRLSAAELRTGLAPWVPGPPPLELARLGALYRAGQMGVFQLVRQVRIVGAYGSTTVTLLVVPPVEHCGAGTGVPAHVPGACVLEAKAGCAEVVMCGCCDAWVLGVDCDAWVLGVDCAGMMVQ
jgi:hypothetical protein